MFIVLEGGSACGKSTQAELLSERIIKFRGDVAPVLSKCSGGTQVGERIREIVCDASERVSNTSPTAELFLFQADMAIWVDAVLIPALQNNLTVICDRYTMSTKVYQGILNAPEHVDMLIGIATQGYKPDITVYIDIPAEEAKERLKLRNRDIVFDNQSMGYYKSIRERYLIEHNKDTEDKIKMVDGAATEEVVSDRIWKIIEPLLKAETAVDRNIVQGYINKVQIERVKINSDLYKSSASCRILKKAYTRLLDELNEGLLKL